jgi:hypothetical protein
MERAPLSFLGMFGRGRNLVGIGGLAIIVFPSNSNVMKYGLPADSAPPRHDSRIPNPKSRWGGQKTQNKAADGNPISDVDEMAHDF